MTTMISKYFILFTRIQMTCVEKILIPKKKVGYDRDL